MKIGTCFLTYNSEDVITKSLAHAKAAFSNRKHDIVVVDNSSADGTVAAVRKSHPEIHLICNARNLGYSAGNNVGGRFLLSQGCDALLFVNPDVYLLPETVPRMWAALTATPDAGCAGGVADNGEGGIWPGSFRNKPDFVDMLVLNGFSRYLPVTRNLLKDLVKRLEKRYLVTVDPRLAVQPVYAVSGACILFRAESFRAIGGFDEASFLFMEEFIVSERLRRVGQRVIGVPNAMYRHEMSSTVRRYPLLVDYHMMRSGRHLIKEYFQWPPWRLGVFTGVRCLELAAHAMFRAMSSIAEKFPRPASRAS